MSRLEELKSKIERTERFIAALERKLIVLRSEAREEIRKEEIDANGDDQDLTERERSILPLVKSRSNKQIASRLGVSERTVKFHVSNLLRKFHVESRTELS